MNVFINGTEIELAVDALVTDAIATVKPGDATRGIAVAVNGSVVPRSSWGETRLDEADRVEILTAVAGG